MIYAFCLAAFIGSKRSSDEYYYLQVLLAMCFQGPSELGGTCVA